MRLDARRSHWIPSLVGGVILGGAISAMHYIAMEAARFIDIGTALGALGQYADPYHLSLVVALVSLALMVISLLLGRLGQRLLSAQERIRSILSATSEAFVLLNARGVVEDCNAAAETLFAHADGLRGTLLTDLLSEAEIGRSSGSAAFETTFRRPDGSQILCLVHANDIFDERDRLVNRVMLFSDIGDRLRIEQRLREQAAQLEQRARTETELREQLFGEIVAESEKSGQSGFKALVHMAGDDLVDVREWIYVSKDGRRIPTLRTMTALRDTNGTLLGYLAIYRDLTVAKEAERLLESAKNAALQARVLHD